MDAIAIWNHSNYRKDLDVGAGFHFNSNQSRLHTALDIGDSLWLVTRIVANERNRKLVKNFHELYDGRCQVTGHDSPLLYGVPTAESHHVVYRSRGGADEMENLILVSPNLHTAIHSANATFDYASLAFIFPNGRVEPLILNTHLTKRAA